MPISNYDDLQAAIVDWAPEISSSDPIALFISLAESDVFPLLKHYKMETTVTLAVTDNSAELPDDVAEIRRIRVDGITPKQVSIYQATLLPGEVGYAQVGDELVFTGLDPASSHSVELTYYATPVPLSSDAPQNWLLKKFAPVYLHASLARAFHWRQNTQAEAGQKQALGEALSKVTEDHKRVTQSGNTIIINGGNPYAP